MSQTTEDKKPWVMPDEWHRAGKVLSTTRSGGASQGPFESFNLGLHVGDATPMVLENRRSLRTRLPADPLWLNQVHGCRVLDADQIDPAEGFEADAAVTASSEVVLAIQTADCLPVIIHAGGQVLGAAHAGWRGLAQGVLHALVDAMHKKLALQRQDMQEWQAWIGPCIGPSAFQVGDEVRQAFIEKRSGNQASFKPDPAAPHKWLGDLPGLAVRELQSLGIMRSSWCGLCTVRDEQSRFFSYRRDGQTGRMATLAWLDRHEGPT